jgi:hypothetical protein
MLLAGSAAVTTIAGPSASSLPAEPAEAPGFPETGIRLTGRVIGYFSFDVGAEIDLERARPLTPATAGDRASRRAAPTYVGHTTPPLRAPLGERPVAFADTRVVAEASAIIHEVGAITIVLTMPLACDACALPALTSTLTGAGPLEDVARALAEEQATRLGPAVTKAGANDLLEDYYVIQVDQLEPAVTIPELLARARAPLAAALRCEPSPLSETEVDDTLRTQLSYYPDDLAISDWNVTILVDPDPWATLDVLEYLNVQLLELRFFDSLLDRRLADSYGLTGMRARPWPLWNAALQRTIDELAAVRLEVASMVERLHNAFKISGDVYLAKLYTRTAERLGIRAWEASVEAKLDVLHQRYALLIERMRAARSELLELLIVVLVALELVVLLAGWG